MKKLTIYEALAAKLGRNPTNEELKAEWKRILAEGLVDSAERGKQLTSHRSPGCQNHT